MCGIEKGLRIRMTGLLAPVEVCAFCGFRHGGGQCLALAGSRLRIEACCRGRPAKRVQGAGDGAGR
jgi:hypothetical protein